MPSDSRVAKRRRPMQKVQIQRSRSWMSVESMVELSPSMWPVVQTASRHLESIKWLSRVTLSVCSSPLGPARPLGLLHERWTSRILLWISTWASLAISSTLSILSLWLESVAHTSVVVVSALLLILVIDRHQ